MAIETKEITFEQEIEYSLLDHGGYIKGNPRDYNREFAIDTKQLFQFLQDSQPVEWEKLCRKHGENVETGFLKKLYRDLDTYGTLYVLRHGVVDAPAKLSLCYFKPASGMNQTSQALYEKNILTITRQVHYSLKNENSIDVVLFINGLPVATVELKNPITGQTVENAKRQYMKDRDPRELLLSFKARCLVHFAVDTEEVWMTTKLNGINTYFLPFNKGNNGGKGNPVGNSTYRTSYLWEEVLQKDSLLDIVQRFIHLQEDKKNPKKSVMIFPRYHQLDVVRTPGDRVQLHAVQLASLILLRQHGIEIAGSHAGVKNPAVGAALKPEPFQSTVHIADQLRLGVVGGDGGAHGRLIFFLGQQGL